MKNHQPGKGKQRPQYSLATLLGVMAYLCVCLPIVVIFGRLFQRDPTMALYLLVVLFPFLLPSVVASVVLCQAMIENISHKTHTRTSPKQGAAAIAALRKPSQA